MNTIHNKGQHGLPRTWVMTESNRRRIEAGVEPARTSQGERYAMNDHSNVFPLHQPGNIDDPLTDILRSGARRLLAQAIELEAEAFLETMKDLKLADGRDRLVRHGHGPERAIQTGIGPVEVSRVKIRDRGAANEGERFGLPRRSFPFGHDGRGAWIRCCRCSTCGASRRGISRRLCRRCWARTRPISRLR